LSGWTSPAEIPAAMAEAFYTGAVIAAPLVKH
jgi:hypothetical protein